MTHGKFGDIPLFALEGATLRICDRRILSGTDWSIHAGEQWAVIGPNGSGKSTLVGALCGRTPVVAGRMYRRGPFADPRRVGYVSFELQGRLMAREALHAEACSFSGHPLRGATAAEVIGEGLRDARTVRPAAAALDVAHLLQRDITVLSSGELRRVLIARTLAARPDVLVLDEPFEGLDDDASRRLSQLLEDLIGHGRQLVLVTHRFEAVVPGITHVIALRDGRVRFQGPRPSVMTPARLREIYRQNDPSAASPAATPGMPRQASVLVDMRAVTVAYGRHVVLDRIDWQVRRGQHWAVVGPNGSGKSTLLSLVSQDHPQAYANDITLFGHRKGSGETAAELRRHIGVVSSRLQTAYRKRLRCVDVAASGFFDSIGLYRRPDGRQRAVSGQWLHRLGLQDLAERFFDQLSYGQQRLVLIARAVVKSPRLLVLDEPCQGLDPANRRRIADMLAVIAASGTTLLYATHHPAELPGCISHLLELDGQGKVLLQATPDLPGATAGVFD